MALDWPQVLADLKPFVERQADLELLDVERVLALLEKP